MAIERSTWLGDSCVGPIAWWEKRVQRRRQRLQTTPVSASGPRRVLLVETNEDGTTGGSHRCVFDLACRMDRQRFTPVVLFYERNAYVDLLRSFAVEVHCWDSIRQKERIDRTRSSISQRQQAWWGAPAAVLRRALFLRSERFALVHLNNSPAFGFNDWLPAARLLRIPCITHSRGAYVPQGTFLGRSLASTYDRVIAVSRYVAEGLPAAGIQASRVRQIYDGIDLADWQTGDRQPPERVREALGIRSDVMLIVMVGHLRWWKGQDVLISALTKLQPSVRTRLHALVVGGAPESDRLYQAQLKRSVQEQGLANCVTFLGDRRDIADLMHASAVVLHASTVPEPFGLVVLEGMALGKAVIASQFGGPAEILTSTSGLLFDPRCPAELAGMLTMLLEKPEQRRMLGRAAMQRVNQFDVRFNVEQIEAVYAEVLGDGGSGASGS